MNPRFHTLLCLLGALLASCAESPRVADDKERITTLQALDIQDLEAAAQKMSRSLLSSKAIPQGDAAPLPVVVSDVINATGYDLDTSVLIKKIRVTLLQSGRVFFVGAGADDSVRRQMDAREDFFRDDGRVAGGQPVYTLSGKISAQGADRGRLVQQTFIFQLSLNAPGGVTLWEDETTLTKQAKRGL